MAEQEKLSNREIRRRMMALDKLSQRMLDSRDSELKVATLIRRYYKEPFEIADVLIKKVYTKYPAPEGDDPLPAFIGEQRNAELDKVLELEQDVLVVPEHLRIKPADLPKHVKGNPENQAGVAGIMAGLGDLYEGMDEPEEKEEEE